MVEQNTENSAYQNEQKDSFKKFHSDILFKQIIGLSGILHGIDEEGKFLSIQIVKFKGNLILIHCGLKISVGILKSMFNFSRKFASV